MSLVGRFSFQAFLLGNYVKNRTLFLTRGTLRRGEVFNEAKNHFTKQAYDLAEGGFKLYIEKYPEGENIQQSYIYLGDAYAAQDQAKPAAIAYATVLQKFPESKLTATARLKYARSIIPLGKTEEAKRYFNSVVQDFGRSPEARLAKEELAKLK